MFHTVLTEHHVNYELRLVLQIDPENFTLVTLILTVKRKVTFVSLTSGTLVSFFSFCPLGIWLTFSLSIVFTLALNDA